MWQDLCNSTMSVSVCLSIRLSVPYACCSSVWWVCCCGPHGQEILIDCCTVHLQVTFLSISTAARQSAANVSSVVFAATNEGE